MLQDEINGLQASLAEELVAESQESDPAEQLALQSTLTVLAERMSTIRMKAAGKRQLLEVTGALEGFPVLLSLLAVLGTSVNHMGFVVLIAGLFFDIYF